MRKLLAAAAIILPTASVAAADLPTPIAAQGATRGEVVPNHPPLAFCDPAAGALTGFGVQQATINAGQ